MLRALLFIALAVPAVAELRTWTDSTGKHKTEAELLDAKGDTVYLRYGTGTIKTVPLARLSVADQEYVRTVHAVQVLSGDVIGLADGDTITLLNASKTQHTIRLEGIDAPESGQDFGTQSRKALGKKIIRKSVRVEWNEKDRHGHILGNAFLDGRWINREQVAEGWAWHSKQYNDSAVLAAAEDEAREAKLGLWAQPAPIAPWNFRQAAEQPRGPPPDVNVAGPSTPVDELAKDETVYIIATRNRYHRAGCKYLDSSSIPISLSGVQGLYTPCKICHPELVKTRAKPEKKVAAKRPRKSYNKPRTSSPPAFYFGDGGGGGGGGTVHVRGYHRKDGTYVRPHTRSAPSR